LQVELELCEARQTPSHMAHSLHARSAT
jgi:hypothetical protein